MKSRGSMTAAMSLMLLVLLSLTAAGLQAAQNACARVQAVNSADTGLYSLFSEYDQDLLETYHLFFLDGGYGTGELDMGRVISHLEHYMNPVLSSGLTRGSVQACAAEGLRIASDEKGKAVQQQMIRYMKENLGLAGIERVRNMLSETTETMNTQESIRNNGIGEAEVQEAEPMEGISENNNPLEIISNIRNHGFLGLVLPEGENVSEKEVELQGTLSRRTLQTGRGDFSYLDNQGSALDKVWIQEYALEHVSSYTDRDSEGPLDYEAEYLLGGKKSDQDNLSYVVNRLFWIREVSNIAYLYTNVQKRAELEACAAALSFLMLIPEGMMLVQAVLAAGWAYIESLSDVRILLSGDRVPMIKDAASWRTQLNNLSVSNTGGTTGLDYEDYLRILLFMSSKDTIAMRTMDVIEMNMRRIPGKESFALDACMDALSFSFQIKGPGGNIWQANRMYTYDM